MTAQRLAAIVAALSILLLRPSVVLAHGHVEVGDYELVIGFRQEPAYQGEPNGLELHVTNKTTGARVNGLAATLRVAISYGSSRKELALYPQFGQDGAYAADFIPTRAGDYTWHIWGEIEETPVDVVLTSGPGSFSPVEAKTSVAFPVLEPTPLELQAAIAELEGRQRLGFVLVASGATLGLTGFVIGLLAWRSSRRRAAAPAPAIGWAQPEGLPRP